MSHPHSNGPDHVRSVRSVKVIEVEFLRGSGCCEEDPSRVVTAYYAPDGTRLAERDPIKAAPR